MTFKRVVITGAGALTPIGNNLQQYWEGLKAGKVVLFQLPSLILLYIGPNSPARLKASI
jgi:3-oxoacyl-(acyl-carrier-protein) synthase